MRTPAAFRYPGQGSQRPGRLHTLPAFPAVTATLDEAAGVLSRIGATDLDALDSSEALHATTNTQLALAIAGVAAAVTAGVLTFDEALEVVRLRGELMQRVCAGVEWGMGAVLGLGVRDVRTLTQQVSTTDDGLWIANVNAPDQIVLSGTAVALQRAESAAPGLGARRWQRLDLAVASRCPLQEPVAARLAGHLAGALRRPQRVPYLTNVRSRRIRGSAEAVLDDLARSVAHPVPWYHAMRVIGELGATDAIQMPPGQALARLLTDAAPATREYQKIKQLPKEQETMPYTHIRSIAALGSSYAAGPGIKPVADRKAYRSARNYPHLLAERLGATLTDLTVSGATTDTIIDTPQRLLLHTFPPQLNGLPADADLVTITAGGNDLGYIGSMVLLGTAGRLSSRALTRPLATALKRRGVPHPAEDDIDRAAANLSRVVEETRRRAKHAGAPGRLPHGDRPRHPIQPRNSL